MAARRTLERNVAGRGLLLAWPLLALQCAKGNPAYSEVGPMSGTDSGTSEGLSESSAGSNLPGSDSSMTTEGSTMSGGSTTDDSTASESATSTSGGPPGAWLGPEWAARKPIRIHPPTDVDDFPVGIALQGDAELSALARADGRDIVFTAADGTTVLPYEIEFYASGDLAAWVQVPELRVANETIVFLYYGRPDAPPLDEPAATWPESDYGGVWHLSLQGRVAPDSTQRSNDAAAPNDARTPTSVPGMVGAAAQFDGVDDALPVGDPLDGSLDFGMASFSVGVWVSITQSLSDFDMVVHKGGGNVANRGYGIYLGIDQWRSGLSDGANQEAVVFGEEGDLLGQWNHIVIVADRESGEFRGYLNGVGVDAVDISAFGSTDSDFDFEIGRVNGFEFKDVVDEVRVYSRAVSPDWVEATYENLARPDDFYTVEPEQTP